MTTNTFEQRLAYQIGVKLAQEAYFEKEASWANVGKGVKSFASGRGWTQGAGSGFGKTMKDLGGHLKEPWQKAYQGFGARGAQKTMKANKEGLTAANENLAKLKVPGSTATPEAIQAAEKNVQTLTDSAAKYRTGVADQYGRHLGTKAQQGFIPRATPDVKKVQEAQAKLTGLSKGTPEYAQAEQALAAAQRGAVDWGQVGTMAGTGALAAGAGYGAYNLGRSAVGANTPQPQQSPHSYYYNQLFGR
jgi:hypothetical protein